MTFTHRHSRVAMAMAFFAVQAMSQAVAQTGTAASPPKFDSKGIARTETVRRAFDGNREAIQVRVDFAPGASFPRHSHPGVEIAYVLNGTIEYELDGKTVRLQAGQSLYIPAGAVHSARNVGADITAELATYVVDKNQPIVILDK
jgi:quercetin dioxygenase-like cupin family protein